MMKNDLLKKIVNFIKVERRLFLVAIFLGMVFLINQALYANHKKTTESCAGGKCLIVPPEKPQLTKDNAYYFVDDLFKNQSAGYYRLTFQEKSDQAEKIILKLNTYTEKENKIDELSFESSDKFKNQEIFFFLPEGFDSLLFQKENSATSGNIFIKEIGITKLNVTNQSELALMKKTVLGETDSTAVEISQPNSDDSFPWLKEKKIILGQVFQAKEPVISAVAFKIDINKNLNPGSRQYSLSLREVKYDEKKVSLVGPIIVDTAFSVGSIEKYRQVDGTFIFPLYGILEKDKYYLISLDNSKVEVSNQNYLEFRGSKNNNSYPNGSAVMKKQKELYAIDGDLYFKIYGANLLEENGIKILNGAKIESLGKGLGKYSYATKGKFVDLLDLATASTGTEFSEGDKIIYAPAKDDASFSYVVNTLYPINKLNFYATQNKAGWKKVKVSYSFDQNNWIDLASSEKSEAVINAINNLAENNAENNLDSEIVTDDSIVTTDDILPEVIVQETVQVFDAEIIPTKEVKTIYFKISYDSNDASKGKLFALKNLKITADLNMK